MKDGEQKTKNKKLLSNIANWVLGLLIVFLVGCQVQIIRSRSANYNVPSLFGYSFMTVLTDSMANNTEDPSQSLDVGTGVIMQKVAASSIAPSDVITFYSEELTEAAGQPLVVSHRVFEIIKAPADATSQGFFAAKKDEEYSLDNGATWQLSDTLMHEATGGSTIHFRLISDRDNSVVTHQIPAYGEKEAGAYEFFTCGDNLQAQTCKNYASGSCSSTTRDPVPEKYYLGRIVYRSNTLGKFLSTAQEIWFIPVCCLVPLLIIVVSSLIDLIKVERAQQYSVDREILLGLNAAGIDFNDEKAVYLFSEKQRYKIELRESMQKEKDAEKKRLLKEMKKKGNTGKMEDAS